MERLAVCLAAESVSDNALTRLRVQLRDTVRICEEREDTFRRLDLGAVYAAWDSHLFGEKRALILRDREMITDYPYPMEREREQLLRENRVELNDLDNERNSYRKENFAWIVRDYYTAIRDASRAAASILDSYFPVKEKATDPTPTTADSNEQAADVRSISPDEIFRTRMFDKLRELEARLVKSGDLDETLHWQAKHKNGKPDIKRLVTFLAGLLDNGYFLPNRNTSIKRFFEERYRISIGQNFERRRREPLVKIYRTIFYDFPF
ncbi:MAG: hypothetical protein NC548_29010 [Lachnospiraceae bacterium]|nr:hypothetical protein [Lachnospiraceae bacterium]